jgi:hypothetical protein
MRESAAKSPTGYIPRYVDLDFVLLEQLGMARQDINIRQSAPVAPVADTDLREALKQLIALQIEEKQGNIEREKRVNELEVPNVNTMAAAPSASHAAAVRWRKWASQARASSRRSAANPGVPPVARA